MKGDERGYFGKCFVMSWAVERCWLIQSIKKVVPPNTSALALLVPNVSFLSLSIMSIYLFGSSVIALGATIGLCHFSSLGGATFIP